jgi:phosphoglycerate-specific signal transduction histidine kinase
MNLDEQVKEFDNMIPIQKIRAVAALKEQDENFKKLEPIRNNFESSRNRIINIININDEYQIIEYETKIDGKIQKYFSVYINFKNTNNSTYTLEQALITALSIKYDGYNTRAPIYIIKMLGMEV